MDLMSFLIVGAGVSVLVQVIKRLAGTSGFKATLLAIIASLAAAAIYQVFKDTVYWQTFLQILAGASLVYSVIIKNLE